MQKRSRGRRPYYTGSRFRRKKPRGIGMFLLVTAAVLAYTGLSAMLGVFLADKVFLPLNIGEPITARSGQQSDSPGQTAAQSPISTPAKTAEPSPSPKVNVVKDFVFSRIDFYAVQIGAFSMEEAAQEGARDIMLRGGAGYVLYDVRYRVFASLYLSESDAKAVKDNLMNASGIDSYIYTGAVPAVELTITASQGNIDAISSGYTAWREALDLLKKVSDLVDSGDISVEDGYSELKQTAAKLKTAHEKLAANRSVEDESGVLSGLCEIISNMEEKISAFCETNDPDTIAFSAAIKYNYIEAVFEYKDYISAISASFT